MHETGLTHVVLECSVVRNAVSCKVRVIVNAILLTGHTG